MSSNSDVSLEASNIHNQLANLSVHESGGPRPSSIDSNAGAGGDDGFDDNEDNDQERNHVSHPIAFIE